MKKLFSTYWLMAVCFALLNVLMYFSIKKFWIGGSSFLPLIGVLGPEKKFLFAFVVNLGVIIGAFLGALSFGEFKLRLPAGKNIWKAVLGGFLIGMGVTMAPGTCTTAFVTGIPMLSVASFLSAAGIFIGAFVVYSFLVKDGGAQ
ncbi:MAG: YeeE/YedE family protein [Candidatus Omnitrophica bacterium]|nr:YeeE/YedE family protein [Candidatus Omnitrophota bacterium]